MPNKKLADFLDELANADDETLAAWCDDPKKVIRDSGLSEDHKKLLNKHVLSEICKALDAEANQGDSAARTYAVIKVVQGVIKSSGTP
jgi:hypothetical protein